MKVSSLNERNVQYIDFKVQADIFHTISMLHPSRIGGELFGQYYPYDPLVAADMRRGNPIAANLDSAVCDMF